MGDYLLALDAPGCADPARAGAKAAALARLAQAGFQVPDAVVLTTDAFHAAHRSTGADGPLPDAIERAVIAAAARFGRTALAVRSSSPVEDQALRSFAGQFTTVLDVVGAEALVAAVRRVWASADDSQLAAYRPPGADRSPMAVLIQRLVDADAAGVAFTADPVTGDRSTTVVEAIRGRGEQVTAGQTTPHRWRVELDGRARPPAGEPAVDATTAVRVATLARAVAAHAGAPQDVEWALADDRLWVLQTRPITALPPPTPAADRGPVTVVVPDGYWQREATHAPTPRSPFFGSFWYPCINRAFRLAFEECGALVDGIEFRDIGGWEYGRAIPPGGRDRRPPPQWMVGALTRVAPSLRARNRRAEDFLARARAGDHADEWYHRWRPDLMRRIDRLRDIEPNDLSDPRLAAHLDETLNLLERTTEIHFRLLPRIAVSLHELATTCHRILGWNDHQALALLSGLSAAATAPARALADLADQATDHPDLRAIITGPGPDALERVRAADPSFAAAFDDYLRRFGFRSLRYEVAAATLGERPDVLFGLIRDHLTGASTAQRSDRIGRDRTTLEADALRALPPGPRGELSAALGRARHLHAIRDDNEPFTLSVPLALVRRVALHLGQRLADRGQIDTPDDVFLLDVEEARAALADGTATRPTVARRRTQQAWVHAHPGPPAYGPPPPPPPSFSRAPAPLRTVNRALSWYVDQTQALTGTVVRDRRTGCLHGIAASPGRHTGPVRVIHDEDSLHTIRPGDVVVCTTTSPVWSVLFPSIGALVTDVGGVLSHPAIIAREHGIPAVVATGDATRQLTDGQLATVNGSTGTVELI